MALQALSGIDMGKEIYYLEADTNGDGKAGMEDVLFILKRNIS